MQEETLPPPSPTPASSSREPIRGRLQQPSDAGDTEREKGEQQAAVSSYPLFSSSQAQQKSAARMKLRPSERTLAAAARQEQLIATGAPLQEQPRASAASAQPREQPRTEQRHSSSMQTKGKRQCVSYAASLAAILQSLHE